MIYIAAVVIFIVLYIALWAYKRKNRTYIPKGFYEPNALAFFTRAVCLIVSFALLAIAKQGSVGKERPHTDVGSHKLVDEVVFLLDTSASMLAQDSPSGKSRFDRAKEIITEIVENLGGIDISLIAFAGDSTMIVPSTEDYLYFRILLDNVRINEPDIAGTNFAALFEDVKVLRESLPFDKSTLYVLLSDGEESVNGKELDVPATVDVIGFGTAKGAPVPNLSHTSKLDRPFLEGIAKAGSGKYFEESGQSLLAIVDNIVADIAIPGDAATQEQEPQKRPPTLPLIASFFFILAALLLPQGKRKMY